MTTMLPADVLRSIVLQTPGAVAYSALGEPYWTGYTATTIQAGVFEADQGSEIMEQGSLELGDLLIYLEDGQWPGINLAFPVRAWGFTWQGQTYRATRCHRPAASWGQYWKVTARRDPTLLGGQPPVIANPDAYEGLVALMDALEFYSGKDFLGAFSPARKAASEPLFTINAAAILENQNWGEIIDTKGPGRVWEVVAEVWARVGNQPMDSIRFLSALADLLRENRLAIKQSYFIRIMSCEINRVGATANPDTPAASMRVTLEIESSMNPDPVTAFMLDETEGEVGDTFSATVKWTLPAFEGRRQANVIGHATLNGVVQPEVNLGAVSLWTIHGLHFGVPNYFKVKMQNSSLKSSAWSSSILVNLPAP